MLTSVSAILPPVRVAALVKQIPEFEHMKLGADGRLERAGPSVGDERVRPSGGCQRGRAGRIVGWQLHRDHARPAVGGGRVARGDRVRRRRGRAHHRFGIRWVRHARDRASARRRHRVGGTVRSRARRSQLGRCRHRSGRTRDRRAARPALRHRREADRRAPTVSRASDSSWTTSGSTPRFSCPPCSAPPSA